MAIDPRSDGAGGIGVCSLLGVAFVVLRLCGVIDWSWWWVTSPLWIPFAVVVSVLIGAIAVGLSLAIFRRN